MEELIVEEARSSAALPAIGRVIDTLLNADSRCLDRALALAVGGGEEGDERDREAELQLLHSRERRRAGRLGLIDRAVVSLLDHVDADLEKFASFRRIAGPLLEHVVRSRDPTNRKRVLQLFEWLLRRQADPQDGMALVRFFETALDTWPGDKRQKLGICLIVRGLVEKGAVVSERSAHSERRKGGVVPRSDIKTPEMLFDDQDLDDEGAELLQLLGGRQGGKTQFEHLHASPVDFNSHLAAERFMNFIPALMKIVKTESVQERTRRMPTRLTSAAVDCILTITRAVSGGVEFIDQKSPEAPRSHSTQRRASKLISELGNEGHDAGKLLWHYLKDLCSLVKELLEWYEGAGELYVRGLRQIEAHLQILVVYRDSLKTPEGKKQNKVGVDVLAASWRHYGRVMMQEDRQMDHHPEVVLAAYVDTLQHFSGRDVECGTIREKGAGVILRCYDLERGAEDDDEIERSQDIRLLALSCIAMVIGKLEGHKLERMMDAMLHKSFVLALLAQLCSSANRIADLSGAILDELLFGSRPTAVSVSPLVTGRQLPQVDFIMQVLPEMLETRGFISHAATGLLAKCFAVSPSTVELNLLFQKLKSQQSAQRKNALAIIHHIVEIFAHSSYSTSDLSRQLATHLLINLGNAELINKVQISTFFAKLEPEFILREFVHLLHSRDARVRQAAATAILEFLKKHPDKSRSIVVLLDYACLGGKEAVESSAETARVASTLPGDHDNSSQMDTSGLTAGSQRVMFIITNWLPLVEESNWDPIISGVLSRMFEDPSKAIYVDFLKQIRNQLERRPGVILPYIRKRMCYQCKEETKAQEQKILKRRVGEEEKPKTGRASTADECPAGMLELHLHGETSQYLGPLLALGVLPITIFDDMCLRDLYGDLANDLQDHRKICQVLQQQQQQQRKEEAMASGSDEANVESWLLGCGVLWNSSNEDISIARLLLMRMFSPKEDGVIRKFAAEIFGCLNPRVTLPLLTYHLAHAVRHLSSLRARACLFAICTALMVRGGDALLHPWIGLIQRLTMRILLWPLASGGESGRDPQKEAHAAMDLFAVIIRIEAMVAHAKAKTAQVEYAHKSEGSPEDPNTKADSTEERRGMQNGVLETILDYVTGLSSVPPFTGALTEAVDPPMQVDSPPTPSLRQGSPPCSVAAETAEALITEESFSLDIRRWFVGVVVNACEKAEENSRPMFAARLVPHLLHSIQTCEAAVVREHCLLMVVAAGYNLKAQSLLPFAEDLMDVAMSRMVSRKSSEERMQATRLLGVLLSGEEQILCKILPKLLKARQALQSILEMNPSPMLRDLCEQLLACLS